jgi:eukaryotic-like serine/threonine-protein kinase
MLARSTLPASRDTHKTGRIRVMTVCDKMTTVSALPSMQVLGRYTIYGKIASGGMASVHFGRLRGGEGFARTVAIKRLHPHLAEDPEFRSTLIDEARMAARIHHPNVVPTLDVVSEDRELLVVMEYVYGESVSRLWRLELARGRRIPLPIVSAIAAGALQGLHAAHEAKNDRGLPLGLVHRDVSPQNILVGVDGLSRVIDFGVAKAAGRLQTTREGTVKGKVAYMAPEQIGSGHVTRRADVYAMGVVVWEMLTGKRLFQGDNEASIIVKVLAGGGEKPSRHAPNLPSELDALVMRALAPNADDRFATALEMAEALVRVVPPALSTEVGRWVEEVASDTLAERTARLAEIESSTGVVTVPPPAVALDPRSEPQEALTLLASQPSSLSVEKPSAVRRRLPSRRVMWAGAAGATLLALGVALAMGGRGMELHTSIGAATATTSVPATVAPVPAPTPWQPVATAGAESPAAEPSGPGAVASVPASSAAGPPRALSLPPRPPPPATPPAPSCTVVTDYDSEGQPHFKKVCK